MIVNTNSMNTGENKNVCRYKQIFSEWTKIMKMPTYVRSWLENKLKMKFDEPPSIPNASDKKH